MVASPGQQNLDAECRALEAGHHARVQPGGAVLVSSDTYPGKAYRVTFEDCGAGIRFRCVPEGEAPYVDDHLATESRRLGVVPCFHAALAARRLERERLAALDVGTGLWKAIGPPDGRLPLDLNDPFLGLPGVGE